MNPIRDPQSKFLVNSCPFRLAIKNNSTLINVQKTLPRVVIRLLCASAWVLNFYAPIIHSKLIVLKTIFAIPIFVLLCITATHPSCYAVVSCI